MRHAIALLLVVASLGGCSTVGNVFKKTGQVLMEPSIQVGSFDDQPTQVALSLYASPDVNPNPVSCAVAAPVEEALPATAVLGAHGPFAVNLHSASKDELIGHLQSLLGHLEHEQGNPFGAPAVRQRLTIPGLVVDEHAPALTLGKSQPETLFTGSARVQQPVPSTWLLRQGPVLPAGEDDFWAAPQGISDLGQYAGGAGLAPAAKVLGATGNATPIGFRVLQLKDDSLLENVDPAALRNAPDKALGSTLLTSDDYILAPGQFKFIEFAPVNEQARYIAVVAEFHTPNAERWHDVFRIEPRGRKYPLLVMLQGSRIAITDESYRPVRNPVCAGPHASTYR